MKRPILAIAALAVFAASVAAAAVESGLKPGASVGAFEASAVTGPNKGTTHCYRCSYGNAPVVAAFIKTRPANAGETLTAFQKVVDSHRARGLMSFVVFMGDEKLKKAVARVAAEKKISVPLNVLPKGTTAPDVAAYRINPKANVTVLLWRDSTVKANVVDPDAASWARISQKAGEMLR